MRGSVTINPRGSNTSSNSGGVKSYLELDDRLDSLIDVDVTNPSTSTPVSIDNPQAVGVSIDANAKTITSTVDGWGNSGVWDNSPRTGDFHVSGRSTGVITGSRQIFGMSLLADAPAATPQKQRYAWFFKNDDSTAQVREINSAGNDGTQVFDSGVYTADDVYSIVRTGSVITYLKNGTLVYTSLVASTGDLYFDVAFGKVNGVFSDLKYGVDIAREVKYTLDLKNPNVIGYHVDELVSDTNFADIATALADDAVKAAIAGDFVEIDSRIYHVIKTNPTLAIHLKLNDEKIEDATNAEVTAGTSQDFVLFSPFQIHEKATAVSTDLIDAIPEPSYITLKDKPEILNFSSYLNKPDFNNSYSVGVSYDQDASTLTSTAGSGWNNSGSWDNTPITNDGEIRTQVDNDSNNFIFFGLSDFVLDSDRTNASYTTIDYGWYFRGTIVEIWETPAGVNNQNQSTSYTGLTYSRAQVYSIKRQGSVVTYLIDGVVAYTSTKETTSSLYLDTSFLNTNTSLHNLMVGRGDGTNRTTIDYNSDLLINKPAGGGSTTAQATDGEVDAGTETEARLFTPKQIDTKAKSVLPTQATQAEMTAGTEEGVKGMSPKQIKDATDALISAIPASGGGTASNIAWENVTNLPAFLNTTNQPESVNPVFVNSGGVTVTQSASGADVESTAAGWGNSGTWDEDNSILADGAVSFIITSVPSNSEQMLGLSYKNSEADATSLTFSLIDYAWYFRLSDRKAFVRETDSSGITNSTVSDYTGKVFDAFQTYSINRVGNKVNYLIDGVIVYTSSKNSSGTLHVDLAFKRVNSAFSQIRIQRNLTNIYETKLDYSDPGVINKPKYLQEVRTSYSDEHEVALAGATAYHIAGLDVNIVPKRATSKFVISFDVKACAPIGHIFSLSIYIDDTKINAGTTALHNVDAVVPVPETSGGLSVLNSVTGSLETSHSPVLNNMTVRIYAWYHKDSVATDATSLLTFNRAKRNISGLAYKMQGTSMLRVEEIEV